ncbi:MAG: VTT domain-containing protein, partial [Gammaproteobacteria bacterium]|nr:VTT domain-containing protein [Gammaproteobacteria bacterium]
MNKTLMRWSLFLLLIIGVVMAVIYRDQLNAEALEQWISNAGVAGPLLFMLLYAIATVFFLPGSVLTLAGGALFGPVWGTLYNLTGATLGAIISFLAARYLASDWAESRAGGRLKQLKQGVESEGWKFVAFVRLVPLFPFNVLNYALGLTRISAWHYTIASFVFMLPGAIAYTYLGYAGREAIAGGEDMVQKIMLAVALLAVVGFLPSLIARLRRGPMLEVFSLKQMLDTGQEILLLDVRDAKEFTGELSHIRGAINIPLGELATRLNEINEYQERAIAIICHTDRRSAKAAQFLSKHGYADVQVVSGGMTSWTQQGM